MNLRAVRLQRRAQQVAARYQSEHKPVPENIARAAGAQAQPARAQAQAQPAQAQAQPAQLPGAPAAAETSKYQAPIQKPFVKQKLLFTLLNLLCLIGLWVVLAGAVSAANFNGQISWLAVALFAGMLILGVLTVITRARQLKYQHEARISSGVVHPTAT
jgi:hypothetical protein